MSSVIWSSSIHSKLCADSTHHESSWTLFTNQSIGNMSLCPLTMSPLSLLVVLFFCRHACALSMHQWSVNKLSALIPKLFTAANNRSCRRRFCFVREQVGWIRGVSYRRMLQNYPTHYQSYCQVALYQSTIEEAELIFVYLQRLLCFLLTDGAIVFVVFLGWFRKSKTCILCASLSCCFMCFRILVLSL